jgi:Xaa-Pro dipeptidase
MKRREFLTWAGTAAAALAFPGRVSAGPARPATGGSGSSQAVGPLSLSTYRRRLEQARALMSDDGLAAVFSEPGTNFTYLTGARFGRSERLLALIVPADGRPAVVAPGFEVERVEAEVGALAKVHGWAEHESPYDLVGRLLKGLGPGRIGVEPTTRYGVAVRLQEALTGWEMTDAGGLFTRLRIVKSEEEIALIRRAVSITEVAIAATLASLESGVSEREVAEHLSREIRQQGASGGGLVQFGPGSAVPHGGAGDRRLERGMPVLIDAGCRVQGYTSDITRTHFFGDDPSPEYREVFNTVLSAQTAAFEAGRPGMEAQQLDRIARSLIAESGYGDRFTHRLGHGLGMEGHEPPYLVEGNRRRLEPGMVFTIEPGIYLPGRWGVRIEDDFVVGADGLEALSSRAAPI